MKELNTLNESSIARMYEEMKLHGFSRKTIKSYLYYITQFESSCGDDFKKKGWNLFF